MSKYKARRTTVDGVTFDSKGEANRYAELRLLEAAGKITDLQLQPRFGLQPKFETDNGEKVRAISYVADFQYFEDGRLVVEDFKGMETPAFKLKLRMLLYKFRDITVRITGRNPRDYVI